jgi:hypothetical protein
VSGQHWQTGGDVAANFETGEGIPAWAFKIEGRMLEVCLASLDVFFLQRVYVLATKPAESRQNTCAQIFDIDQTNGG